jgi:hypothetical protein
MTAPAVIEHWLEVVESGDIGAVEELLAPDAVFYSPAVFSPQRGRATAAAYLRAAGQIFAGTGFHYVEKWFGDHSAVLHFAADVDGLRVEGIDMIHWDDDGRIVSVKVMIRPFKALQGVIGRMAELLSAD